MKRKKVLSMVLAAALLTGALTGCGGETEDDTNVSSKDNVEQGEPSEPEEDQQQEEESGGELTEITVALRTLSPVEEAGYEAVQEAVNEITEQEINVKVNLMWVDAGTYDTTVPMMITGNEKLDLMMYTTRPSTTYATFMAQKQLLDITDYIEKDGSAIKETLGEELLQATSKDGRIYGVGNYGPLGFKSIFMIRKDYLEQAGMLEKAENAATWTELEEVMQKVVEVTGEGIVNSDSNANVLASNPCMTTPDAFMDAYVYDNIGDSADMFMANTETGKVECLYFNEDYQGVLRRTYDWYQKGLVYKDAATAQDVGTTLLKNGVGSAYHTTAEVGGEPASAAATGHDMLIISTIDDTDSMITTGNLTKFGFCVPVTATEPEAAIKFLNLLYESDSLSTLLSWGIEGRDYVINEEGLAEYPEGVTAETCLYHIAEFLYGSRMKVVPWAGCDPNVRQIQQEFNDTCKISPFLGFCIDSSSVENELTACINVVSKYKGTLHSGSCTGDYDAYYQQFLDELTAAGVDKLVAAYQEQLDAWREANQ